MGPHVLHRLYLAAHAVAGIDALASFAALSIFYARKARQEIRARLERGDGAVTAPETVTRPREAPLASTEDAALTAAQAARETGWTPIHERPPGQQPSGFSARWFYDHASELPFTVRRPGDRAVRFSRAGLRAWLAAGGRGRGAR